MPPITPRTAPLPPVIVPKVATPAAPPPAAPTEGPTVRQQLERDSFDAKPARSHLGDQGTTVQPKTTQRPAKSATPKPLGYERAQIFLNPPNPNQTKQEVANEVNRSFKGQAQISGTRTDEEFKAVGNALLDVSAHAWGKETDLAVKINGKERHITIKLHDDTGKAEAILLPEAPAWAPAKTFKTQAEAAAALKKDFGIDLMPKNSKQRDDWNSKSKDFSLKELEKVYDGLSRLSDKEKEAVKGVKLARVDGFNGPDAAAFESGMSEAKDSFARDDVLVFGDTSFSFDKGNIIGGANDTSPASLETITHEIGHAVETMDLRKAEQAVRKADIEGAKAMKGQMATYNSGATKLSTSVAESVDFRAAGKAAKEALDDLRMNDDPTQTATLRKAAKDAMDAAKASAAQLPKPDVANGAKVLAGLEGVAKIAETKAAAVDALDKADGSNGSQSAKLESFLAMAKANNVKPFTDYAATGEQEFFAEGFALYKSDPTYLKENHPKAFEWFEKNGK